MLNILVPLAGKDTFNTNENNAFPKILSDIDGSLLIERAAQPFINLKSNKKIVVAVPEKEAKKYQLNKILPLLDDSIELCNINSDTQGALCSALLAIEHLDLDFPLIISSFEQVFDFSISPFISAFLDEGVDAGVLTFDAIHPKWSYVKIGHDGFVTQAAEKIPISRNAVAGLYFFKSASIFIEAAKDMIRKDVTHNGLFYISPTLNEIILNEGRVKAISIDKQHYFHINDDYALERYENNVGLENTDVSKQIKLKTEAYTTAFNDRNLENVGQFFSESFKLTDPAVSLLGKEGVLRYIDNIFNSAEKLCFKARRIITTDSQSIIEFELTIDQKTLVGTDVIQWDESLKMTSMDAYLYEKSNG